MSRTVCIPRYSLHVVTRRKAKVPRARQRLQYCSSLVSRLRERGSAAAIMEWVEGRPNSLSHRSSILTAGGMAGRGLLRTSFRACRENRTISEGFIALEQKQLRTLTWPI